MKALTWQGLGEVRVEQVPDPVIQDPTDAIVRVTSTAICGSDLHLYGVLAPYLQPGDILGHEFMGIVEEVGPEVGRLQVGDRVVVPFTISCGTCWMCSRGLFAQCETTQVRDQGKGAALFGYTSLYGSVPGGQAEYVRVPHADFGPVWLGPEHPDERYLYLSDILPTAWQGVQYAEVPEGGTLAVLGLGPVGLLAVQVARHLGVERLRLLGPRPVAHECPEHPLETQRQVQGMDSFEQPRLDASFEQLADHVQVPVIGRHDTIGQGLRLRIRA